MKDTDYMMHLVEKYLDGLTSVDEERRLAQFIRVHRNDLSSLPEELQIVAEMLDEIKAMPVAATPKRGIALMKWTAAALTAAAAVAGVIVYSGWNRGSEPGVGQDVLYVKASRAVEAVMQDPAPQLTLAASEQSVAEAARPPKKKPRKQIQAQTEKDPEMPSSAPSAEPRILPMADPELPVMVTPSPEVRGLMLECEMKILEDQYQAYESSRRTINI